MFWRKKTPPPVEENGIAPPWEHIDTIPKRHSEEKTSFDLVGFTASVTGFGRVGAWLLLLLLIFGTAFVSYLMYKNSQVGPPPPPNAHRPAIDKYASSTRSAL